MANGELVRGRNNAAGELGYLIVRPDQLAERSADTLGGLERVISGPAIARRASELLGAEPSLAGVLDPAHVTSEDVFSAARAGHPIACRVVDEVLESLLIALITLVVTADPSLIIIDGGVGRSLEPYLDRLRVSLAEVLPWVPELAVSPLGAGATVVGAIATALWLDRQRAVPDLRRRPFNATTVLADVG